MFFFETFGVSRNLYAKTLANILPAMEIDALNNEHFLKLHLDLLDHMGELRYFWRILRPIGINLELNFDDCAQISFSVFSEISSASIFACQNEDYTLNLSALLESGKFGLSEGNITTPALLDIKSAWYGSSVQKSWQGAHVTNLVRNMVQNGDELEIPANGENGKTDRLKELFQNLATRCANNEENKINHYLDIQTSVRSLRALDIRTKNSHDTHPRIIRLPFPTNDNDDSKFCVGDIILAVNGAHPGDLEILDGASLDKQLTVRIERTRYKEINPAEKIAVQPEPDTKDTQAEAGLKEGDYVKLKDSEDIEDDKDGPLSPGMIGTVIRSDLSDQTLKVKVGERTWWYQAASLELSKSEGENTDSEENKNGEYFLEVKCVVANREHNYKFKVGQSVRIYAPSLMTVVREELEMPGADFSEAQNPVQGKYADSESNKLVHILSQFNPEVLRNTFMKLVDPFRNISARYMFTAWLDALATPSCPRNILVMVCDLLRLSLLGRVSSEIKTKVLHALDQSLAVSNDVQIFLTEYAVSELSACASAQALSRQVVFIESEHNYPNDANLNGEVVIPGATALKVVFDPRCRTEGGCDELSIFDSAGTLVKKMSGDSGHTRWPKLRIAGDRLTWQFQSDGSCNYWGYKFAVSAEPLSGAYVNLSDDAIMARSTATMAKCLIEILMMRVPKHAPLHMLLVNALAKFAMDGRVEHDHRTWALTKVSTLLRERYIKLNVLGLTAHVAKSRTANETSFCNHEFISKREEDKFKIGDRVKVKASVREPRYGWGAVDSSSEGVIKDFVGPTEARVDFHGHEGWAAFVSELEHVDSNLVSSAPCIVCLSEKAVCRHCGRCIQCADNISWRDSQRVPLSAEVDTTTLAAGVRFAVKARAVEVMLMGITMQMDEAGEATLCIWEQKDWKPLVTIVVPKAKTLVTTQIQKGLVVLQPHSVLEFWLKSGSGRNIHVQINSHQLHAEDLIVIPSAIESLQDAPQDAQSTSIGFPVGSIVFACATESGVNLSAEAAVAMGGVLSTPKARPHISEDDVAFVYQIVEMGFGYDQALFAFNKVGYVQGALDAIMDGDIEEFPYGPPISGVSSDSGQDKLVQNVVAYPTKSIFKLSHCEPEFLNGFYEKDGLNVFRKCEPKSKITQNCYVAWKEDSWIIHDNKDYYQNSTQLSAEDLHSIPPKDGWVPTQENEGAPMPTIEVVNDYLHEPGPEQVTSPSERGESNSICVKAPTSSLELLVRRLPGFFEIQYQYELQFRKKSLVQSDYLLALSGLCQTLDLEAIAFESKGMDWLRSYAMMSKAASALVERTPFPRDFMEYIKRLPMFKFWGPKIPKSWGSEEKVFNNDEIGSLSLDHQIVEWAMNPMSSQPLGTEFVEGGTWSHPKFPDKTFTAVKNPTEGVKVCALKARTWSNAMFGGGCDKLDEKHHLYFRCTKPTSLVICSTCMYHMGTWTRFKGDNTMDNNSDDSEFRVMSPILDMPIAVLECRSSLITYIVEQGLLCDDKLPAFLCEGQHLLSALSRLIPAVSKLKVLKKKILATMKTSESDRPKLVLNRLGLRASPKDGLIGPNGSKSLFSQVMVQMELAQKKVPDIWLRSKRLFKVERLAGEGIDDAGGGYSEIISHMMTELAVDNNDRSALPLLRRTPNARNEMGVNRDTYILNSRATLAVHMKMFRFLGIMIGVAVRTDSPINLPLTNIMWDMLLGRFPPPAKRPLTFNDSRNEMDLITIVNESKWLVEVDELAWQELFRVASMNVSDLEDARIECKFADSHGINEFILEDKFATKGNIQEYILTCLERRRTEFTSQVQAVRKGIAEVLPIKLLSLLTFSEFERLVCGDPDFDVDLLVSNVRLDGYRSNSDQIQWLWKVLREFTPLEKSQFLRFVGGFTRLPQSLTMWPHQFEVHKTGNHKRLPSAATCFFTLKLPEYRTEKDLGTKLRIAMMHCASIDTDGRGGDFEQI
eukprot:m.14960 g.14960  ORF g.14960 m.14960 type:complete len:1953 (-) comp5263_c0_seq1:243-6101(-)